MAFRSVPRPSSPPGAKASTECPSRAQIPPHAQEPPTTGYEPKHRVRSSRPSLDTTRTSGRLPAILDAQARMPTRVRPTRTAVRTDAHQPLHADKEHDDTRSHAHRPAHPRPTPHTGPDQDPLRTSRPVQSPGVAPMGAPWWRRTGSNRRPPACKAGALPAELRPQTHGKDGPGRTRTSDPTLIKRVL